MNMCTDASPCIPVRWNQTGTKTRQEWGQEARTLLIHAPTGTDFLNSDLHPLWIERVSNSERSTKSLPPLAKERRPEMNLGGRFPDGILTDVL